MADYGFTEFGEVQRATDRAVIPSDPANADYQKYLLWVDAGNTTDPYVKPAETVALEDRRRAFDADATRADLLTRLRSATPAQINSYVDNNVNNLAEARALFKKILLVLAQT